MLLLLKQHKLPDPAREKNSVTNLIVMIIELVKAMIFTFNYKFNNLRKPNICMHFLCTVLHAISFELMRRAPWEKNLVIYASIQPHHRQTNVKCRISTIGDKIVETLYLNRVTSENKRIHTPPLSPPFNVGVFVVFYR